VKFIIPVKTVSESNQWDGWRARYGRKKKQQEVTAVFCRQHDIMHHYQRDMTIRLTRLYPARYPRTMDQGNIEVSFKNVQDQIAKEIAMDDKNVKWQYHQRQGDDYGVEVELIEGVPQ
jgi:hypothetical protein